MSTGMNSSPGASSAPSLRRDERGAVLLVGIFAAALLFGAAFFVLGVGDSISHRETMQDAADTGAYTTAVLNARAMNLVVLLNLTKLSVAATVTSLLAVIAGATKTIAFILSLGPTNPLLPAIPALTAINTQTLAQYESIRSDAESALRAADRAQLALAERMPEIAAAQASRAVLAYGPPVSRGTAVARPLPIRRGQPITLCQKAMPLATPPALRAFDPVAPEPAKQHARLETSLALMPSCLSLGAAAMELQPNTQLGGERFQLRYYVVGGAMPTRGENGVEIASWERGVDQADNGALGFAQAEYYFDGDGAQAQKDADELWTLGWRARFRRFRAPDLAGELSSACRTGAGPCGQALQAPADLAQKVAH
ncbi:MAG TPA: hypothetical protein VKB80_24050 [Kofleriaceae bacterium]|nr:hypothetical protein [Kofleriaceae bacterium]